MQALVLAGARASDDLRHAGIEFVPLLEVHGQTILERTVASLVTGGGCERVLVLAPEEVPLPDLPEAERGPYTGDLMADLTAAAHLLTSDGVLIATGDMPLITPEAVAAVVEVQQRTGAELVYPAIRKEVIEKAFGPAPRTYKRLAGVTVTGANLFYLSRVWVLEHENLLRDLFEKRKDPLALARFFGAGFLFKVQMGSASLEYCEQHLGKLVGATLKAPVLPFPELGMDIDKLADLEAVRPYL
jgi:GTP:adenosylcobinamide-phosphate guanylyltransferase